MHASKLLDVIKRAEDGPICMEKDFDFSIMRLKLKELIKDYDIRYDPEVLVPSDDSLADAVFNAALELYLETGTYCLSTHRQIKFEEDEIRLALHEAPSQITFGAETDERVMANRRIEDRKPPLCLTSGGCEISEDIYAKVVQSLAQEPLADTVSGGYPLKTIFGMVPRAGTPIEILASTYNLIYAKEGTKRAGRPLIGFHNLIGSALSEASYINMNQPELGVRPVDGMLIATLAELKTDYSQLAKALYYSDQDTVLIGGVYVPLMGGYAGGPEGTAIVTLAHHLQGVLTYNVAYSDFPPLHLKYSCSTAPETIWIASIVCQALSRNTHLLTASEAITAAGPCTDMCFLEVAAMSIAGAVSGCHINNASAAKSQYPDRNTGMEAKMGCEVGHAATGLKRTDANDLVTKIMSKYEQNLKNPPLGLTFQECYDLNTVKPSEEHVNIFTRVKKELEDLGLKF
ncbi:monomethylamine:corrinoid methyltransferase [Candidatus Borrarchaeum sp.]|uniref:monomethylamine:corrinoid methyltransferase n=1 Tax=Candidatus Borrarchaeum sp. TaxID=2846742 RepID=UPI00257EC2CA|nr:monomethylamine:corrinoid methyltransferase [Candidatus Borrarchaeum sp.]